MYLSSILGRRVLICSVPPTEMDAKHLHISSYGCACNSKIEFKPLDFF